MRKLLISTCLLLTPFVGAPVLRAQNGPKITHVLVISIDGMHSQDLQNWVQGNPNSALARLAATGVNYTGAYTTQPSDSIPATVGIFTGASPALGGMYYDDAWHRTWAPPYGSGTNHPQCNLNTANGTAIDLKQGIDFNGNVLDAGGGINPDNLPRDPFNNCSPVYPHNMIRVNTIFEVVRAAGMYTAYSEKRPAYDFLNGPSGTGVQDLYVPEINAVTLLDPSQVETFDTLRVNSILNEINERNHDGTKAAPQPALFGMNFQAINSAKKSSPTGGYVDLLGNFFDTVLANEMAFVDRSIGSMITALREQGLANNTVVIITAKHGESPLSNTRTIVLTTDMGAILSASGVATNKITQKTSGLIWLKDRAQTGNAVTALTTASITPITGWPDWVPNLNQVLSFGAGLPFPNPAVDPAVPDIVTVMNNGVNFEPSAKSTTHAEHGGFGENETHVPLLVSNPKWTPSTASGSVSTRQIAPTVLSLLGLDPKALDAVRKEGVPALPEVLAK